MEDNSKPAYFDRQYDKTPYTIIDEYREERETMTPDDFYTFLYKKLEANVGLSRDAAERDARSMIDGQRVIIDGDYALLENAGEIYIRRGDIWVQDKTLTVERFLESNKIFCNIQKNCVAIEDKCVDNREGRKMMMDQQVKHALKNFDNKYESSIETIREKLAQSLKNAKFRLTKIHAILQHDALLYNKIFYKIALQLTNNDIIVSPFEQLKNRIMEMTDILKRHLYIIKFCKFFCRTPLDGEDTHWLYCNRTGNKLLPAFLLRLAEVAINRGDYQTELDTICAQQGTISDDGNNWVDKYSGYIIKIIEFNTEEGFDDQGSRLQSREIIEKEYTLHGKSEATPDTKTVNGRIIAITNAISGFMGIDLSNYHEFIVNNVLAVNRKNIPSEANYEKMVKRATGDKKLPPYRDAVNMNLIISTLIFILIAIQTSIPAITSKRVFPGCVKSFSGYPLESDSDKTGLIYIACIANKIKTNIEPWSSILKINQSTIVKKMETIIEKYVIPNREIKRLIAAKIEYQMTNSDAVIDGAVAINSWTTFLPPLNQFEIEPSRTQPIEKIDSYMQTNIGRNRSNQLKNMLSAKIRFLAFDVFRSIERVVEKNRPILSNNSGDPFLENSCCDSDNNVTIDYFIQEDPSIGQTLDIISVYSTALKRLDNLATASTVYSPISTKRVINRSSNIFSEATIYNGFIYYCRHHYTSESDELIKSLCGDPIKNVDYKLPIQEIIELYKREGRNYSAYDFENLLLQISRNNIINVEIGRTTPEPREIVGQLIDLDIYRDIFSPEFAELFKEAIVNDGGKDSLREFKNYMSREIKNIRLSTTVFLNANSKVSRRDADRIAEFFDKLIGFDGELRKDVNINYWIKYLKNMIHDLVAVFPSIIINRLDTRNVTGVSHWNLSSIHNRDIILFISEYYERLARFYDNEPLVKLLEYVVKKMSPITIFLNHINYKASSKDNPFDKTVVLNIMVYSFFNVIHSYLHSIDDDLVRIELYGDIEIDLDGDLDKSVGIATSDFIISILEINMSKFRILDYNNQKIVDKILKSREIEKTVITDGLKALNDEEREIANIFKNNKLGDWNIGLQKGMTQYVKDNYDAERERLEQQAIQDKKMGDKGIVTEMNREIYRLDQEYEEQIQEDIDRENYDMGMIPDDGDFDPDDVGGDNDEYANY